MMTHILDNARLADEPIEVRREAGIVRQREIEDGLTRRSIVIAEEARLFAAVSFARTLQNGRAIGDKLRGL